MLLPSRPCSSCGVILRSARCRYPTTRTNARRASSPHRYCVAMHSPRDPMLKHCDNTSMHCGTVQRLRGNCENTTESLTGSNQTQGTSYSSTTVYCHQPPAKSFLPRPKCNILKHIATDEAAVQQYACVTIADRSEFCTLDSFLSPNQDLLYHADTRPNT